MADRHGRAGSRIRSPTPPPLRLDISLPLCLTMTAARPVKHSKIQQNPVHPIETRLNSVKQVKNPVKPNLTQLKPVKPCKTHKNPVKPSKTQ